MVTPLNLMVTYALCLVVIGMKCRDTLHSSRTSQRSNVRSTDVSKLVAMNGWTAPIRPQVAADFESSTDN